MREIGIVYVLVDPRDGSIHYVGQTTKRPNQRLSEHICRPAGKRIRMWIEELSALELRPSIEVLEQVPRTELLARERFWIKEMFLRREPLAQLADEVTLMEMHRRGMF